MSDFYWIFLKASALWFVIALLAIANGLFRESLLVPNFGQSMALPVSGMLLSLIVFIVTYLSFTLFGKHNNAAYFLIGVQWVLMTLSFEFLFGHYMMGKSWSEILHVFNIMKGNLFSIVLIVSLLSPLLVAKIKGR